MNAIPTMYAGVQFRSRLEARYAAYWDLGQVDWQYEPLDLDGYIPDFLIRYEDDHPWMLIEIKPALAEPDFAEACMKIDASGWEQEARLFGINPWIMMAKVPVDYEDYSKGLKWSLVHPFSGPGSYEAWIKAGNIVQWNAPRP